MTGTKAPPPGGKPPDRKPSSGETPNSEPGPKSDTQARKSGQVTFDARGNAVWESSTATGPYGRDVDTKRLEKLNPKDLQIVEEPKPVKEAPPSRSERGLDPYNSAGDAIAPAQKPGARPKDLRKLGEWLKQQKELGKKSGGE